MALQPAIRKALEEDKHKRITIHDAGEPRGLRRDTPVTRGIVSMGCTPLQVCRQCGLPPLLS